MVIASCRAGLIGSFPAPNGRTIDDLDAMCAAVVAGVGQAPWALNMLVHKSYARFQDELEIVRRHQPPIVITALGSPGRVVENVHRYGGLVFADVSKPSLARKAVEAGADGLVLLCSGAGGHTGLYNPFALIREVRDFWDGPIILSGAVTDARSILAAQVLGADLVYMGTRFLACEESLGEPARKAMTVSATLEDIVLSAAITGVPANWMKPSLDAAGLSLDAMAPRTMDFTNTDTAKPWKNIWGAGHGVGAVTGVEPVHHIVAGLCEDYAALRGDLGLT